ncbi:hypothetical protein MHBO_003147 [Bonamia ostreae]|uniref:Uncharacterized protein n=1 Tax=Bonamia ostreae TaxID=126728 RepID=A0ABV2APM8_9EUKA
MQNFKSIEKTDLIRSIVTTCFFEKHSKPNILEKSAKVLESLKRIYFNRFTNKSIRNLVVQFSFCLFSSVLSNQNLVDIFEDALSEQNNPQFLFSFLKGLNSVFSVDETAIDFDNENEELNDCLRIETMEDQTFNFLSHFCKVFF